MLFTHKLLQVIRLVTCHVQGVTITILEDNKFLFVITNLHYGCSLANTYAMYTMYDIIPLFWCGKLRFWRKHCTSALFSYTLTHTNHKHLEVRIAEAVFYGEWCHNNTGIIIKIHISVKAECGIHIPINKALRDCSCLFLISASKQNLVAIFDKLAHITEYAYGIKIIFCDGQTPRLNEGLGVKHRIGKCQCGEADLSPQKKLSFHLVEVDDCIYMAGHNFTIFNKMLKSATKLLAQNIDFFVTRLWLIYYHHALKLLLFCNVVNNVKQGDKIVPRKGNCPNKVVVKDSFLHSFGIYL